VAVEWPKERARIIERRANGEDLKEPEEMAPVWFSNKMTKVEFLAETEEIKAEVEKYRQSHNADLDDEAAHNDLDPEEARCRLGYRACKVSHIYNVSISALTNIQVPGSRP